eukprot:6211187-Pleurochrysis_carterae.AAC.5
MLRDDASENSHALDCDVWAAAFRPFGAACPSFSASAPPLLPRSARTRQKRLRRAQHHQRPRLAARGGSREIITFALGSMRMEFPWVPRWLPCTQCSRVRRGPGVAVETVYSAVNVR